MNQPCRVPRGFTAIELVVIVVLIGILAAVAFPALNLLSGADDVGFRDEVIAALEYSRKSAIAQRRQVRVSRSGNTLSFAIDADIPEGAGAGTYGRQLIIPGRGTNQVAPRGSATLSGPASLVFDSLGRATAASYVYTVGGATVTVEAGTGYVR